MEDCLIDCINQFSNFTKSAACQYVKTSCIQNSVQFIQGYYCNIHQSVSLLLVLSILMFVAIYYAVQTASSQFLTPILENLSIKLNMSQTLAGVTLLALANGSSDILTAIVAGTSSSSSTMLLPFGSLYGASLFSTGFILSKIIRSNSNGLQLNVKETILPLGFYILGTVYILGISLVYKKMNIIIALIFFIFYFAYIAIVLYRQKNKQQDEQKGNQSEKVIELKKINQETPSVLEIIKLKKKKTIGGRVGSFFKNIWMFVFSWTVPIVSQQNSKFKQIIIFILSSIPIILGYGPQKSANNTILQIPILLVILSILIVFIILKMIFQDSSIFKVILDIYAFVVVVAWISTIVAVLINLFQLLQLISDINPVFLGMTVLAGANCIADFMSIMAFSKKGQQQTAVAGIFSGQLLNFLIGFGLTLLFNSSKGQYPFVIFSFQQSTQSMLFNLIVIYIVCISIVYSIWLIYTLIKHKQIFRYQVD